MNDKLYKLMNWPEIEAVIYSEEDDPHRLLGPHKSGNGVLVQAFLPNAECITLKLKDGRTFEMEQADEMGYFAVYLPEKELGAYTYVVSYGEGTEVEIEDPYRFGPIITKSETEKFNAGIHYTAYDILGAHLMEVDGVKGVHFAVWAPNAMRVSVVGDFNHWDGRTHQMRRLWDSGIFELFLPCANEGDNYKYELKLKGGLTYLKADPYAFGQQMRPETASVVRSIHDFPWEDDSWIQEREKKNADQEPVNVYEMYLGSFRKPEDGRDYYNYRELAPMVIEYIKEMGYTHIELMPVMEHPFDGSWGYQVIGYYAPTARYGTPEDFMYFMNEMHKAGIGVILDWVPAHFPRDVHGLSNFDGTCLYEHKDPRQGAHPHWGTLIYNYGRPEVRNYLIANALYWIEVFHADGIRMDAVASMLYLDYGKNDGEWVANMYGGNENLEAMEFLKHVNSMIHKRGRGALSIAEESTAWPKITGALEDGGLGFDLKWNMGWMNDFLGYIRNDPYFRSYHHGELTFSMIYAYSEKFMLVLSHDEVVHGKASMIGKMPGEIPEKFANLKAAYGFMMFHPGKKLLFMGQDIGEFDEWNENRAVEWELLEHADHKGLNEFQKKLNQMYLEYPALTKFDSQPEGFEWLNGISANECTLTFLRKTDKPEETLVVAVNFANEERKNYTFGVPFAGKYKEILNSDAKVFGGEGRVNSRIKEAGEKEWDGREFSLKMHMAPLSISIFQYIPYTKEELKEIKAKKAAAEKKAKAEAAKKAKEAAAKKAKAEAEKKAKEARKAKAEAARKEKAAEKKAAEKKTEEKNTAASRSLKEELAEKVAKADEAISKNGEKEKPVKVVRKK